MGSGTILAFDKYKTNAELIVACRDLGYLRDKWWTLDPCIGVGTFWRLWQPQVLIGSDLDPEKNKSYGFDVVRPADVRDLPYGDNSVDAVVFDPPYKLNGRPDPALDDRYGVGVYTRWQDRMQLIRDGLTECARVFNGRGYLLLKCQDQVVSGKVRWQTIEFANHAATLGLRLVDRLDKLGGRAQPDGTSQKHARRNSSSMLVFAASAKAGRAAGCAAA